MNAPVASAPTAPMKVPSPERTAERSKAEA